MLSVSVYIMPQKITIIAIAIIIAIIIVIILGWY